MGLEQVCSKKDKRLLVLLALGTLIMFSDFELPVQFAPVIFDYSWLELPSEESSLYRIKLPDHSLESALNRLSEGNGNIPAEMQTKMSTALLDAGRRVGLPAINVEGRATLPPVSPRLAFLLGQPFSVNVADLDDLTLIPGIGPALAANIIAYREKHGPILEPGQLEDIPGIGPRKQRRLQQFLTCSTDREDN